MKTRTRAEHAAAVEAAFPGVVATDLEQIMQAILRCDEEEDDLCMCDCSRFIARMLAKVAGRKRAE